MQQCLVAVLPVTTHEAQLILFGMFTWFMHMEHCGYVIFVLRFSATQQLFAPGQYNLNAKYGYNTHVGHMSHEAQSGYFTFIFDVIFAFLFLCWKL